MSDHGSQQNAVTRAKVQIMGRQYTLKGDVDPDYMQELADYVNTKLQELKDLAPGLDQTRLALLVCLNMADELFQARSKLKHLPEGLSEDELKAMSEKAMSLISLLEDGIIGEPL